MHVVEPMEKKKQSTYLFIPSDADELDEFVSLQNRISGQNTR